MVGRIRRVRDAACAPSRIPAIGEAVTSTLHERAESPTPWHDAAMPNGIRVHTLTIDCGDAERVAEFWCRLLEYEVVSNRTSSIQIGDPGGLGPTLLFTWAGTPKAGKNRLHLDLRPDDQVDAVDRALALGARRADIGQSGDEGWVVLQDPEGNEFCLLQSQADHDALESLT